VERRRIVRWVDDGRMHPGIDTFDKDVNKRFAGVEGFASFTESCVETRAPGFTVGMVTTEEMVKVLHVMVA
jgi:hypothetical protein